MYCFFAKNSISPFPVNISKVFFQNIFNQLGVIFNFLLTILKPVFKFIVEIFKIGIISAFKTIVNVGSGLIEAFMTVFGGIVQILSGVLDFIIGIFTGDWSMAWEGVKTIFTGAIDIVTGLWNGLVELLTMPVEAIVNILDTVFKEKAEGIKRTWEEIKEFLKHPIKGTVKLIKKGGDWIKGKIGRNAQGTRYWRGGMTWVGERGPELVDLPRGAAIYPHSKSMQIAREQGRKESQTQTIVQKLIPANIKEPIPLKQTIEREIIPINRNAEEREQRVRENNKTEINIPKLADTIVIREDADIDKIANAIVRKIEKASLNMA